MPNVIVVGAQWGDEGKGKIVDLLTEQFDVVARSQGGHNAGHTVIIGNRKFILHLVPSGILHPGRQCVIGNGVVVDPFALLGELDQLAAFSPEERLFVSGRCHLILPYHPALEQAEEARLGERRIGTTSRGIGPCYEDKAARRGIRMAELLDFSRCAAKIRENVAYKNLLLTRVYGAEPVDGEKLVENLAAVRERLIPMIADTSELLNLWTEQGRSILFEGAQGALLDVDHGTYPYVTSSNATAGGVCTGTGLAPHRIDNVIGISKAYTTRVGGGPFPSELSGVRAEMMRERGQEFGASTGRPRRCGWFDAVLVRYACRINGVDALVMTKLDVLDAFEEVQICTGYRLDGRLMECFPSTESELARVEPVYETMPGWEEPTSGLTRYQDLPEKARGYLRRLSELVGVSLVVVSTGPERAETLVIEDHPLASLFLS
ncbi:MAG TPA: adenylosuccinate synthase [Acidobacteriota bacterium]|nr:adenylosuccinate synthase [Acidobacteriota bacterium]